VNHANQADVAAQPEAGRPTTSSSYYQFEDINNAIIRLFRDTQRRDKNPGSVLDLGCGRGRLGLEVERLGYTVTGIDNSSVACATARTRQRSDRTRLHEADNRRRHPQGTEI
jgi:2-polyprenyl-3-methyl-5-hydroxy-6-metoxy-1,4-benzoquinol methylase